MSLRAAFADALLVIAICAFIAEADRIALACVMLSAVQASVVHGRGLFGWAWGREA